MKKKQILEKKNFVNGMQKAQGIYTDIMHSILLW